MQNTSSKKLFFGLLFSAFILTINAQDGDTPERDYHFNGTVSVTNNGFSFIPLFSLGKPAAVINMSVGGERFSFDPQFRFDLDGFKPWTLIFIWRYKLIQKEKFEMKVGTHLPTYSFREVSSEIDGETQIRLVPYRVMAGELLPTYTISGHVSLGAYYIHGFALEKFDDIKYIDFLSLRAYFTQLHISKQFFLSWNPEVYFLNLYGTGGYYAAQSLVLGHEKIPVSLSTTMNIKLKSDIETKDFDWNISLAYTFGGQFTKNQKL